MLLAVLGVLLDPIPAHGSTEEIVSWIVKGIMSIGVAAIAYLVRDAAKTLRQTQKDITDTRREVASMSSTVAAHQIMFEHWFGNLTSQDFAATPGRRASDQIIRELLEQRQKTQDDGE